MMALFALLAAHVTNFDVEPVLRSICFVVSTFAWGIVVWNFLTYVEKLERGEISAPFIAPTV
jgi:hypothetical protein